MVAACFVILTCLHGFSGSKSCAVNVNKVQVVYRYADNTTVDRTVVQESVEEVVRKFKQECGR